MRSLLLVALAAVLLVPATAPALVGVDIAFDPVEACPGDEVQFFFALENVGAEETMVELAFSFEYAGDVFGPFTTGPFPLAAGEEIAREVAFMISPAAQPGTLTVYVEATDVDGTANGDATLAILDCSGGRGGDRQAFKGKDATAKNIRKMLKRLM